MFNMPLHPLIKLPTGIQFFFIRDRKVFSKEKQFNVIYFLLHKNGQRLMLKVLLWFGIINEFTILYNYL